jgi:hypothetical protein
VSGKDRSNTLGIEKQIAFDPPMYRFCTNLGNISAIQLQAK